MNVCLWHGYLSAVAVRGAYVLCWFTCYSLDTESKGWDSRSAAASASCVSPLLQYARLLTTGSLRGQIMENWKADHPEAKEIVKP